MSDMGEGGFVRRIRFDPFQGIYKTVDLHIFVVFTDTHALTEHVLDIYHPQRLQTILDKMHFLLPVSAFLLTGMQFARADAVDCVRTITMMTNDGTIYYQTNDSTPFTATFTFDYAACKGIPLTGVTLTDPIESTFSRCTYGGLTELPASGTLITTCATTHGGMAASASPDWEISVKVSSKPSYSATSYFAVVEGDSPVTTTTTTTTSTAVLRASELSARRRRDVQRGLGPTPSTFACPSGYKSCPTLSGQGLDCVDVQRDLNGEFFMSFMPSVHGELINSLFLLCLSQLVADVPVPTLSRTAQVCPVPVGSDASMVVVSVSHHRFGTRDIRASH